MSAITILSTLMREAGDAYYRQLVATHVLMTQRIAASRSRERRPLPSAADIRAALDTEAVLLARKSALEEAFRAICEEDTAAPAPIGLHLGCDDTCPDCRAKEASR